jgi:S1-C subfamily serine protease
MGLQLFALSGVFAVAQAHGAPSTPAGAPPSLAELARGPQDGIARALSWTVTIEGNGVYGSGILVAPEAGLVVTNHHVVEEMQEPRITFYDGARVMGQVLEVDKTLDLALVQVPPQPGRHAPRWGDVTSLRPGDEVYAIGCPKHLAFTVSRGIVSFVGRDMEGTRFLQTDLPINDGNSGGPVVNARGELVGLMSFVLKQSQGLSFALPVTYAVERFANRLGKLAEATLLDRFRHWLGR